MPGWAFGTNLIHKEQAEKAQGKRHLTAKRARSETHLQAVSGLVSNFRELVIRLLPGVKRLKGSRRKRAAYKRLITNGLAENIVRGWLTNNADVKGVYLPLSRG